MTLLLFGRDNILSKYELSGYAEKNNIHLDVKFDSEKFVVLENELSNEILHELAGSLRIAEVVDIIHENDHIFLEKLEDKLQLPLKSSFNYGISSIGLPKSVRDTMILDLKALFKKYRLKAVLKNPKAKSGDYIIEPSQFNSWRLDDGLELIIIKHEDNIIIARSLESSNTKFFKELDEDRPERVLTHGTSFRLAKMMVNMLGLPKGSTIIDPFCGTGTFLMMGLEAGYNVIGIDNDTSLISVAKSNVAWMAKRLNTERNWEVNRGDAREYKFNAKGVIFEPFMGPFLNQIPSFNQAKQIRKELDDLYEKTFKNLASNLDSGSRVVCILPDIPCRNDQVLKANTGIFKNEGFDLIKSKIYPNLSNPVSYRTPDGSIVQRNLYLLIKT